MFDQLLKIIPLDEAENYKEKDEEEDRIDQDDTETITVDFNSE